MKLLNLVLLLCLILVSCNTRTYNFYVWQNGNMQYQYRETTDSNGFVHKKWGALESYNKQGQKDKDSQSLIEGQSRAYESGTQVVNVYVTAAADHPMSITTDASIPLIK